MTRQRLLVVALAFALVVASLTASARAERPLPFLAPSPQGESDTSYLLSLNGIKPVHYDIKLTPIFDSDIPDTDITKFDGEVQITINVTEPETEPGTDPKAETEIEQIILHIADNIAIKDGNIRVTRIDLDDDDDDDEDPCESGDGDDCEDLVCESDDEDDGDDCDDDEEEVEEDKEYFDTYDREPDHEFLNLTLKRPLPVGTYEISINYTGTFPDESMYGFYKSTYTTKDNDDDNQCDGVDDDDDCDDDVWTSHLLLVSKFEPTHARKAFPCFDEPQYKATFEVALTVPEGYGVLGNTALEKEMEEEQRTGENTHVFTVTSAMSTYLLAFIVYETDSFSPSEPVYDDGNNEENPRIIFRTWSRTDEIAHTDLSQENTPEIIKIMEEYTGIDYEFGKLDQVAIPDFVSGAMENWGLVTYRETALLFNEEEHSELARKRVVETIAHELSHQWFGDLVTTQWWDSIWLNEGFATYFEYYIINKIHDDWQMMDRLVVDEQMYVFAADALSSSPPLTDDSVYSPSEIAGHFSAISYSKGGSILRMFSEILGDIPFQEGIQEYLEKCDHKTAKPGDLFKALINNAPEGLDKVILDKAFKSWTEEAGYPLLSIEKTASGLKITQKRFLLVEETDENEVDADDETEYYVHITLETVGQEEGVEPPIGPHWLKPGDESLEVPLTDDAHRIVKNTGYFRVKYPEETLAYLTENLAKLEPLQRATLVDDALNLARADQLSYTTAIKLVAALEEETEFIPWSAAFSGLSYLYRMLAQEENVNVFDSFVLHILDKVYEEKGFESNNEEGSNNDSSNNGDTKHIEHVHRANVLTWACRAGHDDCMTEAAEKLKTYLEDGILVNPNLRSVVYCYGLKQENDYWEKLWTKFTGTQDAAERSILITALGCSNDRETLEGYLERSLNNKEVRSQDASAVFSAVYTNPVGVYPALDFLANRTDAISEAYTSMNALRNIIGGIAQYVSTKEQMDMLKELEEASKDNPELEEIVHNAVTVAEANIKWIASNKDDVLNEMEALTPTTTSTSTESSSVTSTESSSVSSTGSTSGSSTESTSGSSTASTDSSSTEDDTTTTEVPSTTPGGAWAAHPVAALLALTLAAAAALR